MPVWAALNAGLLARFEPPSGVTTLHIFADQDEEHVGERAAARLLERLQGRIACEVHLPLCAHKDFNDQLCAAREAGIGASPGQAAPDLYGAVLVPPRS
jgi:hypothetical protein